MPGGQYVHMTVCALFLGCQARGGEGKAYLTQATAAAKTKRVIGRLQVLLLKRSFFGEYNVISTCRQVVFPRFDSAL